MRGRNQNFDLKFGFSAKFRVKWCILIMILYQNSGVFHDDTICVGVESFTLKTKAKLILTQYLYISLDAKFYAESEFYIKILIPPTHFDERSFWKLCVGESPPSLTEIKLNFCQQIADLHNYQKWSVSRVLLDAPGMFWPKNWFRSIWPSPYL